MLAERIAAREARSAAPDPRRETAQRFARVWKEGRYGGFGKGTDGQDDTPLLRAFAERMHRKRNGKPLHIIEGGAGSGHHTIVLAKEGFLVTAVEFAPDAVEGLRRELRATHHGPYRERVTIAQADLLEFLTGLKGSVDAFYANSVLHFLSAEDRGAVYARVSERRAGTIAVSFKAEGDALQSEGRYVRETDAGIIIRGTDGIERLFVRDVEPLIAEATTAGYVVSERDIHRWEVCGYNIVGKSGKFIGFVAEKKEQ